MRKVIVEDGNEGLMKLLGERVTLFCINYIYTGILKGVNEHDVLLEEPAIVYETGAFNTPQWKDVQRLPGKEHYVRTSAIESYGIVK